MRSVELRCGARVLRRIWGAKLLVFMVSCQSLTPVQEDPADGGVSDAGASVDGAFPIPSIRYLSPSSGLTSGGDRVTVRGSGYIEPIVLFFGASEAREAVVLDEQTLVVTTPPGPVGGADIRIEAAGGMVAAEDAFRYVSELRIDAAEPQWIPKTGGAHIRLQGVGLSPEAVVLIDRRPLRGVVVRSSTELEGYTPPVESRHPELRVVTFDGIHARTDIFTAYDRLSSFQVEPFFGPSLGGTEVALSGEGFLDMTAVRFGAVLATSLSVLSSTSARVRVPDLPEGVYPIQLESREATTSYIESFIVYDENSTEFGVLGVHPSEVSQDEEALITVIGRGFENSIRASVDSQALPIEYVSSHEVRFLWPGRAQVGTVPLQLRQGEESQSVALEIRAPLEISTVQPNSGSAQGGTWIRVGGSGFTTNTEVSIAGVPLAEVQILNSNELQARTVAGTHGKFPLQLRRGSAVAKLEDAFAYSEPYQVVRMEPNLGSIAGQTYVSFIGRGLDDGTVVRFGGTEAQETVLENGAIFAVRSPPNRSGTIQVEFDSSRGGWGPVDYRYFDPRLRAGGGWGGAIDGAVNVAVIDELGVPVEGHSVQLGLDIDGSYRATTDDEGLATISGPTLRGAQTVTVGGRNAEFVTLVDVNTRNLTLISRPYPQNLDPLQNIEPCASLREPPKVRGRIFGLKSPLDSDSNPNLIPAVKVTSSQRDVFTVNPPSPSGQEVMVMAEGEEYEVTLAREGTVAIYAIHGDLDVVTGSFRPRQMGIAAGVAAFSGRVTENIDIDLNINMDRTLGVRMRNAPTQVPGPSVESVFMYLNLRSDGLVPLGGGFTPAGEERRFEHIPNISDSEFYYLGGSFTQGPLGELSSPFSIVQKSAAATGTSVDLGPLLAMPRDIRPKEGQQFQGRRLSWVSSGPVPDIVRVALLDTQLVDMCCCEDKNANGRCDTPSDEPVQCSSNEIEFERWRLVGPGGLEAYVFPKVLSELQAIPTPQIYRYHLQLGYLPRFSWAEFADAQFLPQFWENWVELFSEVIIKEETN